MKLLDFIKKSVAPFARSMRLKYAKDKAVLLENPLDSAPGFDPRVNYDEYEFLYNTSPDAQAHIEVITYLVCGAGFEFISEDEQAARRCMDFAEEVNLQRIIENDVITHLIFGNAFNPIVEDDNDFGVGLQLVHPRNVKIKTDKYGRIEKYLYDPKAVFTTGETTGFEPGNMLHFTFRQFANNVYGLSLLHNAYNIIDLKKKIEVTTGAMAHRDAHRLLHARVNLTVEDEAINPGSGKTYAQEKIDAINALLKDRVKEQADGTFTVSNNIVTDQTVELSDLSAAHDFKGIAQILQHLQQQVDRALKVPPVFLGQPEGSNRATSYNQRRTFMLFIEGIQRKFEVEINRKLIPQITDADVKIRFLAPLREDYNDWVEQAVKLYQFGIADLNEAREWVDLPPKEDEEEGTGQREWE